MKIHLTLIAIIGFCTATGGALLPLGTEKLPGPVGTSQQISNLLSRWDSRGLGPQPTRLSLLSEVNDSGILPFGAITNLLTSSADKAIGLSEATLNWTVPPGYLLLGIVISNLEHQVFYYGVTGTERFRATGIPVSSSEPIAHISFFGTSLPDGGATVGLLGFGALGLWLAQRRRQSP